MKSKSLVVRVVILLALLAAIASAYTWTLSGAPKNSSDYQAVLLSNGSVYFGRLEGLGSRFPALREVYYVQSGVDPNTREPKNILLKHGSEWHSPDHMILNADQIVLVEPVGSDSRVAGLITQLKSK